jgi:hydrogenase nickel incorporation protein HypA/HybF
MHEMALCEGILSILEEQAAAQRYRRVKTVWLEVGRLSGIEVDAIRFSFDVVTRGSLADGATLEIVDVPGEAWCLPCRKTVSIRQRYDECPHCGGSQLQVTGGEEMRIRELEVE